MQHLNGKDTGEDFCIMEYLCAAMVLYIKHDLKNANDTSGVLQLLTRYAPMLSEDIKIIIHIAVLLQAEKPLDIDLPQHVLI